MSLIIKNLLKTFYEVRPEYENTDFIIGEDSFEDVQINEAKSAGDLWYFKNAKKGLVLRFILQNSAQVQKTCTVTLIKKGEKFTPRFDFQIWNTTKKGLENFSKGTMDESLIKAKVSLDSCYENFLILLNFIRTIETIDYSVPSYAIVDQKKKDIIDTLEDYDKISLLSALQKKFQSEISEEDISLLLNRKAKLEHFKKLLDDPTFFEEERVNLGKNKRTEDVWQDFFEKNHWIFGYGLQLVCCDGLDDAKLEQVVVGKDIIDGSGKRIDALLKTRGAISKLLFCEIKTHLPDQLLKPRSYRPAVFLPTEDLQGAVAQVQKTIHKVVLKVEHNYIKPTTEEGDPTGEELLMVKPRGVVIIGKLDDFKTDNGVNYEKLSSFEIYRQQINGIEIITYDELYERVKFIVEQ